ncbi:MAG TPA: cytochrome c oxidase subunit III [Methylocystis sp.]|nr:cytochrome c oxidase subunit III [Methylocystis sp.]
MSVMGLFFVFIASVAVLYLARQGVMQSPWLEEGEVATHPDARGLAPPPAAKVGLIVFLAVAGCLFSLLAAAFFMRMESADWRSPPAPAILWVNTVTLALSSALLHAAKRAAQRDALQPLRARLSASGAAAALFLFGQMWAWREMAAQGFYAASNPANAFFYLLTGTHALHLFGGLVALARALDRARGATSVHEVETIVDLCAIYWSFLFVVWLAMLAMLSGGADGLGVICRRLLA